MNERASKSLRHIASMTFVCALAAGWPPSTASAAEMHLVNEIIIPGEAADLSGNTFNRLGAFGSGLAYDRANNVYYAITDRGSSSGVMDFPLRMHKFSLDTDPASGAISNFRLLDTIMLKTDAGVPLSGIKPSPASMLGLSFDPEGIAFAPNGHFYLADEYGPSIREFQFVPGDGGRTEARMVRTLPTPANLLGRDAAANPVYVGNTVSGRQDNRGFEGLTISPDGSKLYAVLQGPLTEDGDHPIASLPLGNGRYSRNVRIVEFDAASGENTAQYVYQLEPLADVNARLPAGSTYAANQQGRGIGASEILAVGPGRFWVIERDDRGVTDEDPLGVRPISTKRLYEIDLGSATNVKDISLAGLLNLPAGVQPVSKRLLFDLQAALSAAGATVVEKYESITFGPQLADGTYAILIGSDNDMSMTRDLATGTILMDVYTSADRTEARYTLLDDPSRSWSAPEPTLPDLGPLPQGYALLPTHLVSVVPEPGTLWLAALACLSLRRRQRPLGHRVEVPG